MNDCYIIRTFVVLEPNSLNLKSTKSKFSMGSDEEITATT